MESRPPHVSLSAARLKWLTSEENPHHQPSDAVVSPPLLPGFLPIRAPLSPDSDFDIYVRDNGSVISVSSGGSEGDELEYETASEGPFVGFLDEETSIGSDGVEEYVLARPFLPTPDEEHDDSGHQAFVFAPVVDDSEPKCSIPIARLSMEDDYANGSGEEELSEVEDGGFQGIGVSGKIGNLPKFTVLGIEEDDLGIEEDDLQPQIKVNCDVFVGAGDEVPGSEKSESLVEQSINDLVEGGDFDKNLKLNESLEYLSIQNMALGRVDFQGTELKVRDAESLRMADSASEYGDESVETMGSSTTNNEIESANQINVSILNPSRDVMLEDQNGHEQSVALTSGSAARVPQRHLQLTEDKISEEEKKKLEKIQLLRVRFLKLVQRLGHSLEDSVVAQVLYQLAIAGRQSNEAFSLESAKGVAMKLEAEGKRDTDFSLNILVLGKTGVGKSATINSIFCEEKSMTNAFEPTTSTLNEIVGTIDGVKIRILDTPGLRSSLMEQDVNWKILSSIKKFVKKFPPDVVLYVDRLDTMDRDFNDLPLLKLITSFLGSSIWRNAIITLTHASSCPPDEPSGLSISYDLFVSQRSRSIQQSISQAVGDLLPKYPNLIYPVSLVENHPLCRKNGSGEKVLPNGQGWRSQLLLLCASMKLSSDASAMLKPRDLFCQRKIFRFWVYSLPMPYLLSCLLQSFTHPKLSTDHGGEK